jgi:hypothetical protein
MGMKADVAVAGTGIVHPCHRALYGTQNCFGMALKGGILDGGEALITAPLDGRPDLPEEVRGIAPDIKSKRLFYDSLVRMSFLTGRKVHLIPQK